MYMEHTRIKEFIEEHGIKQSWVAKRLNISPSYLSLMLSGDRVISDLVKTKIMDILKIQENYE